MRFKTIKIFNLIFQLNNCEKLEISLKIQISPKNEKMILSEIYDTTNSRAFLKLNCVEN
jgi:hypothetical protein